MQHPDPPPEKSYWRTTLTVIIFVCMLPYLYWGFWTAPAFVVIFCLLLGLCFLAAHAATRQDGITGKIIGSIFIALCVAITGFLIFIAVLIYQSY
ncbi:MAG: hypothetical protein JW936_06170 [Sedimentisphaerales bacterium]|nr:hypothetical protein [Sedimentisphaerales bacterium]